MASIDEHIHFPRRVFSYAHYLYPISFLQKALIFLRPTLDLPVLSNNFERMGSRIKFLPSNQQ